MSVIVDFNNYGTINLDAHDDWVTQRGAFTVASGLAWGNAPTAASLSRYTGRQFQSDQSSEVVFDVVTGVSLSGSNHGCAVRLQSGSNSGYFAFIEPSANAICYLGVLNNGVETYPFSAGPVNNFTDGCKLRMTATGVGSATRLLVEHFNGTSWSTLMFNVNPGIYFDGGSPGISGHDSSGALKINSVTFTGDLPLVPVVPVVPVNVTEANLKIAAPKNFLSANIAGQAVRANADGTLTIFTGAVSGFSSGLIVENSSTLPDSVIDVVADEVVLRDAASGLVYLAQNVAVTVSMTAAVGTPGALDTGAEAASTWYYVWLISNGTAVAALFSASATAPVLPAGYVYKARIGAVFNDASSNLIRVMQVDNIVSIEQVVLFTNFSGPDANWNTLVGAPLTAFRTAVPPVARSCLGNAGDSTTAIIGTAVAPCNKDGTVNSTPVGVVYTFGDNYTGSAFDLWEMVNNYSVFVRGGANYNIQYKLSGGGVPRARLTVTGFTL